MSRARLVLHMDDGRLVEIKLEQWSAEESLDALEGASIRRITLERTRTNPTIETVELKLGPRVGGVKPCYGNPIGVERRTGPASRRVRRNNGVEMRRQIFDRGRRSTDTVRYVDLPLERRTGPASRRVRCSLGYPLARRWGARRATDTVPFQNLPREWRTSSRRNRYERRRSRYVDLTHASPRLAERLERRESQRRMISGRRI